MFICIIKNIKENNIVGIIGFDCNNVGYFTNDNDLNKCLDILTNYEYLNIEIEEHINNQTLIVNKKVSTKDNLFLYGIIEHIEYPYKVTDYKQMNGDLKENLINEYNKIMKVV